MLESGVEPGSFRKFCLRIIRLTRHRSQNKFISVFIHGLATHHRWPSPLPLSLLQVLEVEVGVEACRLAMFRCSLHVGRRTREVLPKLNLECHLDIGRCKTRSFFSLECWERARSLIHARNSDSRLKVDLIILVCWNRNHNWTASCDISLQ